MNNYLLTIAGKTDGLLAPLPNRPLDWVTERAIQQQISIYKKCGLPIRFPAAAGEAEHSRRGDILYAIARLGLIYRIKIGKQVCVKLTQQGREVVDALIKSNADADRYYKAVRDSMIVNRERWDIRDPRVFLVPERPKLGATEPAVPAESN